jgi:NAD(P)-dependent dehydrogenase (short-subunit alcohol dehydrogenase family)
VLADVSRAADVKTLIREAVARYGRLDCAHNNAGVLGERALTGDGAESEWDRTLAVNLTGVRLCMRSEIARMLQQLLRRRSPASASAPQRFATPGFLAPFATHGSELQHLCHHADRSH